MNEFQILVTPVAVSVSAGLGGKGRGVTGARWDTMGPAASLATATWPGPRAVGAAFVPVMPVGIALVR